MSIKTINKTNSVSQIEIRKVIKEDLPSLKEVLDSSELFPSEYLDNMISDYLNNPSSKDLWFTSVQDNKPISIAYCAPEKLTEGTYNLYAIAIRKELQGKGIGKAMMNFIEKKLSESSVRVLIVDTSSDESLTLTRKFYKDLGYNHEATIRDFWQEGEDKIIFWKKLA